MKRNYALLLLLIMAGCSRVPDDDVLRDIHGLGACRDARAAEAFYTAETVERARAKDAEYGNVLLAMDAKLFAAGSVYVLSGKEISGGQGTVRIRITDHPVVNMIGIEADIPVRHERGRWRIDRSVELSGK